jgi:hypothetical protein
MIHRIIVAILVYTFSILTTFGQNEELKLMKDYIGSLKKLSNNDSIFIQQTCSPNINTLNPRRYTLKNLYKFLDSTTVNELILNVNQKSKTFKQPKEIFIKKSKVENLLSKNKEFQKCYIDTASAFSLFDLADTLGFSRDKSPYIILTFIRPVFNQSKTIAYVEVGHSSFGRLLSIGTGHILKKHNNIWTIEKGITHYIID